MDKPQSNRMEGKQAIRQTNTDAHGGDASGRRDGGGRRSPGKRHGLGRWLAVIALVASTLTACLTWSLTTTATADAEASSETVTLSAGSYASYGTYSTSQLTCTENGVTTTAYCAQPSMLTPDSGSYTKSSISDSELLGDVAAVLWFGYGGPGFDESMWPSTYYDGGAFESSDYYACTHVILAAVYTGSVDDALYSSGSEFKSYATEHLVGEGDTVQAAMLARADEVPELFQESIYLLKTGSESQVVIGRTATAQVTFTKTSSDATLTDGSAAYSLDGTTYRIYYDNGDYTGLDSDYTGVEVVFSAEAGESSATAEYLLLANTSYYALEVAAGAGYTLSTEPVAFTTGESTGSVELVDSPGAWPLELVKVDAETGETVALAGFSFRIIDSTGEAIAMQDESGEEVSTFTTDETGSVTLPGELSAGTYTVKETATASPYLVAEEGVEFTVGNDGETSSVVVVEFPDEQAMGRATITKTSSSDGAALAGAEYDVVATGDVTSPDGTVRYAEGEVVDHVVTGDDGTATTCDLYLGTGTATFAFVETAAPEGHVLDATPIEFTLSWQDGSTAIVEAEAEASNDCTKVEISKQDITTEEELEGAEMAVLDAEGNVAESWTSTSEPHLIEALPAGTYTLVEYATPHTYDEAEAVEFTVLETGEVQSVVMYDEPIEVSGQIDKKQEIADPVADDTIVNGDGANTAETSVSEEGYYCYTLDYRSTSTTWVDEFTVTDELECAEAGLARLTAVTTAQAWEDYDGLLNVWYQTNLTAEDHVDDSGANATLTDGHENSWLSSEETYENVGDDGRVLDYTGWELWAADLSTTEATYLSVDDLGLEEGEYITAVRFEYGRVEEGFTTREEGWDSETLKDAHDDVDDASDANANATFSNELDGTEHEYASAILHLEVTESYTGDATLTNSAEVDLYRNGGNLDGEEGLEDHDADAVEQTVGEVSATTTITSAITSAASDLAQTGSGALVAAGICLAAGAATGGVYAYLKKRERR